MIPAVILGIKEKPIRYYGFFVTIVFAVFATVIKTHHHGLSWLVLPWELILVKSAGSFKSAREETMDFFALVLLSLAPQTFKIKGFGRQYIRVHRNILPDIQIATSHHRSSR